MSHDSAVQLQLQVQKSLRQRLKVAAAIHHATLGEFAVTLLEEGLAKEEVDRHSLMSELFSSRDPASDDLTWDGKGDC